MEPSDSISLVRANPQGLVVVEVIQCRTCGHRSLQHAAVTFESIKRSRDGWKAGGHAICPECGAAAQAIKKDIPVLASTFECPKCHSTDTLKYEIQNIEQVEQGEFEFEVEIKCSKCDKKVSFKKILKAILDVMSIKIGPEGVTVSKGGD